jgi:multicomponent Na+:H+ antiporter subunit A
LTWLVALLPLSAFLALVWGLSEYPLPWKYSIPWIPSLEISIAFRIDALSAQMLALITGIGFMVFVYAAGYLQHEPRRRQIFIILPVFMLAMIGTVSADNIIVFFAFWELTSISSFLLVGFNHQDSSARDSARQALLITMGGGLALLGGLILLAQISGSWYLSEIISSAPEFEDHPLLPWAIGLLLLGAFTKSAQFPFHFWLPNAMSAPTPVSAYLHSATMVKLGIYLMARFDPAFDDLLLWEMTLISVGTITAVWAAILALSERDLKRILARSTVSALGTLTVLVGLSSPGASLAVISFMTAHALYKAPLFMIAGNIDHAVGTRIIDRLMGLRRVMPINAAIAILAGLSMAGLPLSFGFVAKDLIGIAKEEAEVFLLVSYAFLFINAITAAVAGIAAIRIFWGPFNLPVREIHKLPWTMWLPPLLLALLGLEFEFFPSFIDPLLLPAANAIASDLNIIEFSKTYELDTIFIAAGLTFGTGLVIFIFWDRLHDAMTRFTQFKNIGPETAYHLFLKGFARIAAWHTQLLQSGSLDRYLIYTLAALMLVAGMSAWYGDINPGPGWHESLQWSIHAWPWLVASVLIITGAIAAVLLQDRLTVLMASGLVGYGMAVLFLFAGAPDLAFTQFTVETVLVIVAAALMPRFTTAPQHQLQSYSPFKIIIAVAAAISTFIYLLYLQGLEENRELANWFVANSLSEANGRNVVNVILVDFRAFDTLGEIMVLAFALIAALPLLPVLRQGVKSDSPLLEKSALPLFWIMMIGALWILFRGHNAPGGGFIGGLVAVTASSLLAILRNPAIARKYQPLPAIYLALSGVALALASGFVGEIWGPEYLRHLWWGGVSSVMLFDLGVFFVVWGTLTGFVFLLLGEGQEGQTNLRSKFQENP